MRTLTIIKALLFFNQKKPTMLKKSASSQSKMKRKNRSKTYKNRKQNEKRMRNL